jgi:hypothetical protein
MLDLKQIDAKNSAAGRRKGGVRITCVGKKSAAVKKIDESLIKNGSAKKRGDALMRGADWKKTGIVR